MRDAVIVSYARTGMAKSMRGGFNNTHGATMAGHAIRNAIERARIDAGEVEEVVLGAGQPEGATGGNIARLSPTTSATRARRSPSAAVSSPSRWCRWAAR